MLRINLTLHKEKVACEVENDIVRKRWLVIGGLITKLLVFIREPSDNTVPQKV